MLPHYTNTCTLDMAEFITLLNKLDELLKIGLKFVLKLLLDHSAGPLQALECHCFCGAVARCVPDVSLGVDAKMTAVRQT